MRIEELLGKLVPGLLAVGAASSGLAERGDPRKPVISRDALERVFAFGFARLRLGLCSGLDALFGVRVPGAHLMHYCECRHKLM